jgi:hypothetical protein
MATVQSLNLETRQVLLKLEDGRNLTIVAGPNVVNLEQVNVGDKVKALYKRGVAARIAIPAESVEETEMAASIALAEEGKKPGAAIGTMVRTVVTIVSFDIRSNLVTFATPDGLVRSIVVIEPEMQEFARGLKPGDEVEVTFTEALAIGLYEAGET